MVCLHGLCAVAVWVGPGVNSVNPAPQRDQVKAINRNGIIHVVAIFFLFAFFSRMKLLLIGKISEKYRILQIRLLVTSVIVTSGEEYLICTSSSLILKYVN